MLILLNQQTFVGHPDLVKGCQGLTQYMTDIPIWADLFAFYSFIIALALYNFLRHIHQSTAM